MRKSTKLGIVVTSESIIQFKFVFYFVVIVLEIEFGVLHPSNAETITEVYN